MHLQSSSCKAWRGWHLSTPSAKKTLATLSWAHPGPIQNMVILYVLLEIRPNREISPQAEIPDQTLKGWFSGKGWNYGLQEVAGMGCTHTNATHIEQITLPKTTMSPENWWLEDVFISYILGDIRSFSRVCNKKRIQHRKKQRNKRSLGGPASRPRISSKAASLGLVEGEIFTVEKWRSWEQWTWIFVCGQKTNLKKKKHGVPSTGTNKKSIMSCFFLYKKSMWWIVMGWWM